MSEDEFLNRTIPAVAIAALPGPSGPLILLVVDDSTDDELVSAIASAAKVPADDLGGGWAARLHPEVSVRFTLQRLSGGFERRWSLPGLDDEIATAASQQHLVAVLPAEMAGDLSRFSDLNRLGAAVIVRVFGSPSLEAARRAGFS